MATGKTTRMDAQGRIILPPHIRKELNLNAGQLVSVSLEGGIIKIIPTEDRCSICGESGDRYAEITVGPSKKRICCNCAQMIVRAITKE